MHEKDILGGNTQGYPHCGWRVKAIYKLAKILKCMYIAQVQPLECAQERCCSRTAVGKRGEAGGG